MLIFHNHNLPQQAKSSLGLYGETVGFKALQLVYEAVSCHPDLFLVKAMNELIVASNIPYIYLRLLEKCGVSYRFGQMPVGFSYPESARYNAVITEKYFIHNLRISDPILIEHAAGLEKIHVNQGYTRCNLLALGETYFLTSDKGIFFNLRSRGLQIQFVDPKDIKLPGFNHGFFGGVCGVCNKTVFVSGSLVHHQQGESIRQFIKSAGYQVVELYDGPLFDGGSILFIS
jgi:hypothetical protein